MIDYDPLNAVGPGKYLVKTRSTSGPFKTAHLFTARVTKIYNKSKNREENRVDVTNQVVEMISEFPVF